jgi:hypothetical protein
MTHELTIEELPCGCVAMSCECEHTREEICAALNIAPEKTLCDKHRAEYLEEFE